MAESAASPKYDDISDFRVKSQIYEGETKYQKVAIVDTVEYGRILLLDGANQSSENDEYIYHEALVHPAMLTHGDPRSVLIIGGGEGATLREVLAHESVERLVVASQGPDPALLSRERIEEHLARKGPPGYADLGSTLWFYDADAHLRMFTLPKDLKRLIAGLPPPEDATP